MVGVRERSGFWVRMHTFVQVLYTALTAGAPAQKDVKGFSLELMDSPLCVLQEPKGALYVV